MRVDPHTAFVRLFGHPTVESGARGEPIGLRDKTIALLASLAATVDRPVSRAWLAAELWPDADAEQSRANLRRHLHLLRRRFGEDALVFEGGTVRWNRDRAEIDVCAFDAAYATAPERAAELYRADLCVGVADDALVAQRERYLARYGALLRDLLDDARRRGDAPAALARARALLELDPLDESAARALIEELDRAGDAIAALNEYRALASRLRGELGVVPEKRTTDLVHALVGVRTSAKTEGNVPAEDSTFVGREPELRSVRAALARERSATIVGPGGAGKSRLAWHLAATERERYRRGTWSIGVEPGDREETLWARLAAALGIDGAHARARIAAQLADSATLVVVDECERARDASRAFAEAFLRETGAHLLATSRRRLGMEREATVELGALDVPAATADGPSELLRSSAYRLFVERAAAASPSFRAGPENAEAIVGLLRRIGALPLAIELTAARVRLLAPRQILERADAEGLPPRLDAAISSSVDLLDASTAAALLDASVFRGSFSLAAAEAVLGARAVDALGELREASLVQVRSDGAEMRYALLAAIRAFATSRAGDVAAVRDRHAAYYASLAHSYRAQIRSSAEIEAYRALDRDAENFADALRWMTARDPAGAASFARSLAPYLIFRRDIAPLAEAVERLGRIPARKLGEAAAADAALAEGLLAKALLEGPRAEAALRSASERYAAAGDVSGRMEAIHALGVVVFNQTRMDEAIAIFEEAVALQREFGDDWGLAQAILNVGAAHGWVQRSAQAVRLQREALAIFERIGYARGVAYAFRGIAHSLGGLRELDASIDAARAAVEIFEAEGDLRWLADALGLLSNQLCEAGRAPEALDVLERALPVARQAGDPLSERCVCLALFEALGRTGEWRAAALAYGRAAALSERHGIGTGTGYEAYLASLRQAGIDALGAAPFRALRVRGASMDCTALLHLLRDVRAGDGDGRPAAEEARRPR